MFTGVTIVADTSKKMASIEHVVTVARNGSMSKQLRSDDMLINFEGEKAVKELLSGAPIEVLKRKYPNLVQIKKAPSRPSTKGSRLKKHIRS